jgi:ribosomal protein L16 Arg81 hydroxylase
MGRYAELMDRYIKEVLENPSRVAEVAEEMLEDREIARILLEAGSDDESLRSDFEAVFSNPDRLRDRFASAGIDISEELELIFEHNNLLVRIIRLGMEGDIVSVLGDDVYSYSVLHASIGLLIAAANRADSDRLHTIAEQLSRLTDELESYTLTFEMMLEEVDRVAM